MGFLDKLFGTKAVKEEIPAAPAEQPVAEEVAVEPVPQAPVEKENITVSNTEEATQENGVPQQAAEEKELPPWGEGLQKRLDTYFARLRLSYPDGQIVRLNTGEKKLAERGAELRRLIGYEGKLDEFFALGGFTYQRTAGGRPSLPAEQTASVEERLRAAFPDDVPTLSAVQEHDRRLYLDLRAAARAAGCTVGEYLQAFKE